MSDSSHLPIAPWVERVRAWTVHHFSFSDGDANVSRLLRKVADAIDELGDIEVLEVAFSQQVEGPTITSKVTVYFSFSDEPDDCAHADEVR